MNGDSPGGFPLALLVTLAALVFVLVLAWFALKLLAKSSRGMLVSARGRLRVVQSVQVGARERVVLMEVDGEELLLGVASGGVRVLEQTRTAAPGQG